MGYDRDGSGVWLFLWVAGGGWDIDMGCVVVGVTNGMTWVYNTCH